jgi:uncharacterized metal-binding protein
VSPVLVINPIAIGCLTQYLAIHDETDDVIFPITQDGVQKNLCRFTKDVGLKTTDNLKFQI